MWTSAVPGGCTPGGDEPVPRDGPGPGFVRSPLSEPEFSTLSRILGGTQMKLGSSGGPEGRKAAAAELSGCASAGASPPGQSGVCHQGITDRRASGNGFELSVPNRSPHSCLWPLKLS
ncbi:unnamed protein product [Coccothraustes coccothraustes]